MCSSARRITGAKSMLIQFPLGETTCVLKDAISQSRPDLGTVKGAEDRDRPDRRERQGGRYVRSNAHQPDDPDMKQLPGPLRRLEIRAGYLAEAQLQHVPVDRFADGVAKRWSAGYGSRCG